MLARFRQNPEAEQCRAFDKVCSEVEGIPTPAGMEIRAKNLW
jgi:hypothetical protein